MKLLFKLKITRLNRRIQVRGVILGWPELRARLHSGRRQKKKPARSRVVRRRLAYEIKPKIRSPIENKITGRNDR